MYLAFDMQFHVLLLNVLSVVIQFDFSLASLSFLSLHNLSLVCTFYFFLFKIIWKSLLVCLFFIKMISCFFMSKTECCYYYLIDGIYYYNEKWTLHVLSNILGSYHFWGSVHIWVSCYFLSNFSGSFLVIRAVFFI